MDNELLPALEPQVKAGYVIRCPHCLGRHRLVPGPNNGALLLFYECRNDLRLGAIAGKLTYTPH